jgi:hypothetical protein
MGEAVDRLRVKLTRVVVPPHPSHTKDGKPIMVRGYTYERRGGVVAKITSAVLDRPSTKHLLPPLRADQPKDFDAAHIGPNADPQEAADYWVSRIKGSPEDTKERHAQMLRMGWTEADLERLDREREERDALEQSVYRTPGANGDYWRDTPPDKFSRQSWYAEEDYDDYLAKEPDLAASREDAMRVAEEVEDYFGRPSHWTGVLQDATGSADGLFNPGKGFMGLARRWWNVEGSGPAVMRYLDYEDQKRYRAHVLLHEMAHSVSPHSSGWARDYEDAPSYEEGVVEGWARTHYDAFMERLPGLAPPSVKGKQVSVAYDEWVQALDDISLALGYQDDADNRAEFYDMLIRIPVTLRRDALVKMFDSRMKTDPDHPFVDEGEFFDLLGILDGRQYGMA